MTIRSGLRWITIIFSHISRISVTVICAAAIKRGVDILFELFGLFNLVSVIVIARRNFSCHSLTCSRNLLMILPCPEHGNDR